ncbi:hypothetical protein [Endozoicomonas sp. 4G]|uniref:hypothetical protein n=1 Tax=Endozoicomonas sp. 4G TaxID=2872754 RepID=UPI002078FA43|nr:hypothetical protein [Endozoicomonas sp. 4G]
MPIVKEKDFELPSTKKNMRKMFFIVKFQSYIFDFGKMGFIMFGQYRNINAKICIQSNEKVNYVIKVLSLILLLSLSTFSKPDDYSFNFASEGYYYEHHGFYDSPIISTAMLGFSFVIAVVGLSIAGIAIVGSSLVIVPVIAMSALISIGAVGLAMAVPFLIIAVPIGVVLYCF